MFQFYAVVYNFSLTSPYHMRFHFIGIVSKANLFDCDGTFFKISLKISHKIALANQ